MKTIDYDEEPLTVRALRRRVGEHDAAVLRASRPREGQLVGSPRAFDREYFTAECKTPSTLVAEHGHDRIDRLKLDVEGAWEPILESRLREGIMPRILAFEFDLPGVDRTVRWMARPPRRGRVCAGPLPRR